MKFSALIAVLCVLTGSAGAQMHLPVGNSKFDESSAYVFRDGELTTIQVTMAPGDLDQMLANPYNDVEYPCTMSFSNSVTNEVVNNVTIAIRGNTSRGSLKKSFKLSFNSIVSGTRFHGVKKLNLIGAQNDVSQARTKLALDTLRAFGLPAQRTNLTHLRINDGARVDDVYTGTEQVNDDFLKAWFGNNTGNLYKGSYSGERADFRYVAPGTAATYQTLGSSGTYMEENNDDSPNFTDLAGFIQFVNQSTDSDFLAGLPARFDVDGFLRNMAADVTVGSWDDVWYGANNWYMYHNPDTDRFEWIPYDYDNTFGVDFFGVDWAMRTLTNWGSGGFGSNPDISPLVRRILAVPAWNAQLQRYVHQLAGSTPPLPAASVYPDAMNDTFLAPGDPEFDILEADVTNDATNLYFTVKVAGPIDVGGTTDQARFLFFFDTGAGGLKSNPWGRAINSSVASNYFIGAWTDSGGGFLGYQAGSSDWIQQYSSTGSTGGLSFDMSDKTSGILHLTVPRSFLGLAATGSFTFDVVTTNDRHSGIEPGVDFLSRSSLATPNYSTPSAPGPFVSYTLKSASAPAGNPPFSLTALGSKIDSIHALAAPFAYQGPFSGSTMDWNWTASDFAASFDTPTSYQSPGRPWNWGVKPYISTRGQYLATGVAEPAPISSVCVNEVLALNGSVNHDEAGNYDPWVELYNSGTTAVDVGGMYLSNTPLQPRKWAIPAGSTIPAHGFLLVWTDNQPAQGAYHASFSLIAGGQTVGLYDRDADSNLLINSLSTPVLGSNVSFGRYPDGADTVMLFTNVTPQAPNSTARTYTQADAVTALRIAAGMSTGTPGVPLPDANGDGKVDVLDAALILRGV